ncbi:DUF3048 domain-containing protein [Actinokineospora xionganensis]|nr:DUF3048 domain-containing protein [Actinokineospora xionganensis]
MTGHRRLWALIAVAVAITLTVVLFAMLGGPGRLTTGHPVTGSAPTTTAVLPPPSEPSAPVLAVKIDNVWQARPHTGLCGADIVYVEPVEGGLTRLLALYQGEQPDAVGPVRSARRTDIGLLAQYGTPVFAYSGAAPELLPALAGAELVNASPHETPGAYYRDDDRAAPHNLFVRPASLPTAAKPPQSPPLQFGPAPASGVAADRHQVGFRAADYAFTWSAESGRWAVSMSGRPLTSTECGPLGAATVVEQRVAITADEAIEDSAGTRSPVVRSVGGGSATVLRDGRRFAARWSRPDAASPTRFRTEVGEALPLSGYPVWILLVPQ